MSRITVNLVVVTGQKEQKADLRDDVPVQKIIQKLAIMMDLPLQSPDHRPLIYTLIHQESGRMLNKDKTLKDEGVKDGDILLIVAEIDHQWTLTIDEVSISSPLALTFPLDKPLKLFIPSESYLRAARYRRVIFLIFLVFWSIAMATGSCILIGIWKHVPLLNPFYLLFSFFASIGLALTSLVAFRKKVWL